MGAEPILFVILLLAAVGLIAVAANAANKRRIERYRAIAAANGLGFDPGDPSNVTSLDFELFDRGHSAAATFTMWRTTGHQNRVFQYRYVTGSGKDSQTHYNTCVLVGLPFNAASTRIHPEGFGGRLMNMVGMRDIEFESPTFNERYRITSPDERFATTLIDPTMMGWLLEVPCTLDLYLRGEWMLAVDHKRDPEVLPDLLAYAETVAAHMPTVLQSLYPARP
ncbi:unannotated protein [freshwater metagenome]|uniref:Unannotated protein n=1 Tax=freshwater metagenome TaxID=449393 RepID=A0A6J7ERQ6_9ZZZZ|nr:hypothetical protein [Actinomycetota bacterium]